MDPLTAILESQSRERALMLELEATKLALVQCQGEKEALKQELARALALPPSLPFVREAVQEALFQERIRVERKVAEAQYRRDQRSIWLRSPEAALEILVITAQNGFSAEGFKNLTRAFRHDEQLWDAIKDKKFKRRRSYLMFAAMKGDVRRAHWLLQRSANVHTREVVGEGRSKRVYDSLFYASKHGHLEIVRLLAAKGACGSSESLQRALYSSIEGGHRDLVAFLIDQGAKISTPREFTGLDALMQASASGHAEIVRLLLDRGADVNAKCDWQGFEGRTPLMFACEGQGSDDIDRESDTGLEVVKILIAGGANLNDTMTFIEEEAFFEVDDDDDEGDFNYERWGSAGQSALFYAIKFGTFSVVAHLLANGASQDVTNIDGHTPLTYLLDTIAHEFMHPEVPVKMAKLLLDAGGDVNVHQKISFRNPFSFPSALMFALSRVIGGPCNFRRQLALVPFLLERGADPNATERDGVTALMTACNNGGIPVIIKQLLDRGAVVDTPSSDNGYTALMGASLHKLFPAAKLLVDRGANVNASRTIDAMSPLLFACTKDNFYRDNVISLSLVRFLLDKGAAVNVSRERRVEGENFRGYDDGMTPLMLLAQSPPQEGLADTVAYLLEKGADARAVNKAGKSALDLVTCKTVKRVLKKWLK